MGRVLYDSAADAGAMENHLEREEIQSALATGKGFLQPLLRHPLHPDAVCGAAAGGRDRAAGWASEQRSVAALLLELIPALLLISCLTAGLATLLAYRLSRSIIRPILSLDLGHPESCDTYEELTPLLRRLHSQNETIRARWRPSSSSMRSSPPSQRI